MSVSDEEFKHTKQNLDSEYLGAIDNSEVVGTFAIYDICGWKTVDQVAH